MTSLTPEQVFAFGELRDRLHSPTPKAEASFTCAVGHPAEEQRIGRNGQRECRACAREAKRRRRVRSAAATYTLIVLGAPPRVSEKAATLGIRCIENAVESALRAGDIDGSFVRLRGFGRLVAKVERTRSPLTRRPAWRIVGLHTDPKGDRP